MYTIQALCPKLFPTEAGINMVQKHEIDETETAHTDMK